MKRFSVLLMALFFAGILSQSTVQAQCYSPTFEYLQQTADDSNSAANSYSGGSYDYEDAKDTAGYNFDTNSDSSVVDLRDAGEHPTPMLLRNPGD